MSVVHEVPRWDLQKFSTVDCRIGSLLAMRAGLLLLLVIAMVSVKCGWVNHGCKQ